ncbi:Eco57I restriction-modification methylase domain-containing protein [Iningainema tapete]|uniref:site-specific DNA-methyltransferase (adenine-specific) n=1 Tax=Iningainema tapete BLCC-T55 TaxID=2748662 RepID=A0A8J7CAG6_9CYAN|nr:Eco57I restriction-modification methylase domain-containing protein [Iningainema tapete]MBD2771405.1 Eco57I restriction-modification methylase domain-containing protein [Iningainema tapete BLCC-T55]
MAERLLQLGDIRDIKSSERIALLFKKIGYNANAKQLAIDDLELPARSAEAIWNAYIIADHQKGSESLQVLLFQLHSHEWESPSVVSNRMRSLAQSLCKRPSNFLLLGTKDYDQLMLVNPRKSFDADLNLKVSIRKLLIDRTNPTNYDRDRLEAIAARNLSPQELYNVQCDAFDVEKLTKQFYRGYREIFEQVQQVIKANNPHPYFEDKSCLHQFSQRLLGRIMFLYFLQKKGFLGGDGNFLKKWYPTTSEPEDTDFYTSILEQVFFETLNKKRPNHESPWGKIPYLNGGLFDRDYGIDVKDASGLETPPQIQLPNSLFDPSSEKGILKFFNSYNFTIAENVQGDEEAAVDPEMLGKVFENLLAADERGQSGTFYTPRGIVHFMCVESLSRYLADSSGMDVEAIKQLIEADFDLPDAHFKQLLTKEQAKKLKQALESVKICDPAVGSGAFPLGMMQVMLAVRQAIARREGMTVQRGSLTISEWKRDFIANNLYGVDIKPEAIEIAKLRMWLSLVVDIPTVDDVEPLPNLDYKLMCGDSLISTIHGEKLIPDPTKDLQTVLNVTPIQAAIQPLIDLQHQYFTSHTDERKVLRKQIIEAEKNVFRVAIADRRQYWETEQRNLEQDIKRMKGKASRAQSSSQQVITTKLRELDKIEADVERGMRSLNFFQWHLHFNEVFQQKGGFDIVISNPPYVRQEQIRELKPALQQEYDCYTGTADLFVYFYERGFNLLSSGGSLTYISSNKYMRSGYGEKLRKFLGNQSTVHHLIDFGDAPVFEAIAYPSIILANKTSSTNHQIRALTWEPEKSVEEFASVFRSSSFLIAQKELTPDGWRLESPSVLRLLEKLRNAGKPLGEYVNGRFYYGIKTGLNEAFVVDRTTRDRLVAEHPSSAKVLQPFLRGKDVKRWSVNFAEQYLIKIESSENQQHPWSEKPDKEAEKIFAKTYPAIHNYFEIFRPRLVC